MSPKLQIHPNSQIHEKTYQAYLLPKTVGCPSSIRLVGKLPSGESRITSSGFLYEFHHFPMNRRVGRARDVIAELFTISGVPAGCVFLRPSCFSGFPQATG